METSSYLTNALMDRNEYFRELKKTSEAVKPVIKRYLGSLNKRPKGISDAVMYLASERIKEDVCLLKPFLVRLSYEVTGGKNWERILPICAAAELINISSYQANLCFDGKSGVLSENEKGSQFIASMITRETVRDIIHDMIEVIDYSKAERIERCFSLSNKYIYFGQYYDLNILTGGFLTPFSDFSFFLNLYIERCEGLSGVFSEQCSIIGGILSGASERQMSALSSFGRNFGIGLHIVNDIGDFVPPYAIAHSSLKKSCDQFNDIIKGKLTLPIKCALNSANECQRQTLMRVLGSYDVCQSDLLEVTQIMKDTGAISFPKSLAKGYMKKAKSALHVFEPSYARSLLSVMTSQLRTNKYFASLRRDMHGR
jgi:geranylgeranyl pyrophosphate synthase